MLDQVHSALVDVGNRLYLETRDAALIRETFTANEENRAASLRTLFQGAATDRSTSQSPTELPEAYWNALARLQRAERGCFAQWRHADLAAARAEMVRIEASLGSAGGLCRRCLVPANLPEARSWVWALDRGGLEVYPLPGRATLESLAQRAGAAIRGGQPDAESLSIEIYRTLFGCLGKRFWNAPRWFLALDGALAELPLAALVEKQGLEPSGPPQYLLAHHTVELIPGVAYWVGRAKTRLRDSHLLFVGLGDAIYNRADQRLGSISRTESKELALPRLPGSAAEIETCARAWRGRSALLRGRDATREKLFEALLQGPAVVHLAAHYWNRQAQSLWSDCLEPSPAGDSRVLTPFEISRRRIRAGLVVLSGVHSAAGAPLLGEGALGLLRAWLAAGAESVVGSLWGHTR